MRSEEKFVFQELTAGGDNAGAQVELTFAQLVTRVSITCPSYPLASLNHMVAIAKHGKGPVELTQWDAQKSGLIWSARLSVRV